MWTPVANQHGNGNVVYRFICHLCSCAGTTEERDKGGHIAMCNIICKYTHTHIYIYSICIYYTYTNRKTTYSSRKPCTTTTDHHHHSLPARSLPLPASVTPPGKIGLQPSRRGIQNAEKFRPTQGLKLASLYHV